MPYLLPCRPSKIDTPDGRGYGHFDGIYHIGRTVYTCIQFNYHCTLSISSEFVSVLYLHTFMPYNKFLGISLLRLIDILQMAKVLYQFPLHCNRLSNFIDVIT